MVRLRVLLAWLLMAALPVQGFAAVSMLLCDSRVAGHHQPAERPVAHAHAAHGEHANGHHHAHDVAHHDAHGDAQAQPSAPSDHGSSGGDAGHRCTACGTSCHSVALASATVVLKVNPGAPPDAAEPVARLASRHTPVPDKPPRA